MLKNADLKNKCAAHQLFFTAEHAQGRKARPSNVSIATFSWLWPNMLRVTTAIPLILTRLLMYLKTSVPKSC